MENGDDVKAAVSNIFDNATGKTEQPPRGEPTSVRPPTPPSGQDTGATTRTDQVAGSAGGHIPPYSASNKKGGGTGGGEDTTGTRVRKPSADDDQSFHLSTEETSRLDLSLFLNPSHILTRNNSLLPFIDHSLLADGDTDHYAGGLSSNGSGGRHRSFSHTVLPTTPILKPGLACLTGRCVLYVKKGLGVNGEAGIRVKSVKVVCEGYENVRLKVDDTKDVGNIGKGAQPMKKVYKTVVGKSELLKISEYLLGENGGRSFKLEADTIHTYPFSISLPKTLPPSLNYGREGVTVEYEVKVVVEIDKDEPPLRPTRGGAPVVKFNIVKPGGTRLRNSSRLNSKEVGWVPENSIVCIDQKEWYYGNAPDPERKHEKGGFWRVHVVDIGRAGRATGWITGKSNVIDPVQPSPFLTTGVPVLLGAADVSIPCPAPFSAFSFSAKTEKGTTKLRSTEGCCIPVGAGHIGLELTLNRTIFWKNDSGTNEGGVGKLKEEGNVNVGRKSSMESFDGSGTLVPEPLRRVSPNELHAKSPTCTLRGVIKIKNKSKDEIPQAKVFIMREETISVRKDRKTHRRTNICRIRTLKWGPILPHSVFTRDLAIGVNFSSHPPTVQSNSLGFKYHVLLEADAVTGNYQKCPSTKIDFLLVEGTAPSLGGEAGMGGGGGVGVGLQRGNFAAMNMTSE
ncbi:hypothetical protein TrST_g9021 [Triparma strigata]|uniref:Arrestin-like N-terminal domain-containing protein n=1 Tax=Triparma strigata TaxID=1606541 RepID=A0A9W6ZQV4_9STRA|nr:hypothetical protein TrST_g9021 [Triparma strigata]